MVQQDKVERMGHTMKRNVTLEWSRGRDAAGMMVDSQTHDSTSVSWVPFIIFLMPR